MKIINTVLITLLVILVLGYAALEIFDISIVRNSTQNDMSQEVAGQADQDTGNLTDQNPTGLPTEITELAAQIIQEGSGDQVVKAGDKIIVHYVGVLTDGTKFESTLDKGQPFSITIGVGQVIPGWDQGVIGMKVGEIRRLFVPAEFAYGEQGVPDVIPPNSDLIFDIQLLSINESVSAEDSPVVKNPPVDEEQNPEPENPLAGGEETGGGETGGVGTELQPGE